MDEKYIYSIELYHHGIKGMKWGIRRTKEQLGYKISKARKKHAANAEIRKKKRVAKREEKRAAKQKAEEIKKKASKPINEMTLDELKERQNRLRVEHDVWRMEKEIEGYKKDIARFTAKEVSFGRKVVSAVANKVLAEALPQAAGDATKGFFTKKFKEALGVEGSPRNKQKDKDNNQNANKNKQQNNQKSNTDKQSNKSNKSSKSDDDEPLTGTVSGGYSKTSSSSAKSKSSDYYDPIETEFVSNGSSGTWTPVRSLPPAALNTPASQITTSMVTSGMNWLEKYGAI